MTLEELREKYGELSSALNALAGCIMVAPDYLKVQDGPKLAQKAQDAAFEFARALDEFEPEEV